MHDRGGRMGWLVVLGLYWVVQLAYLLSPIDLVPDFVPVFGFADDLLGLFVSFVVTGVGVWRALPDAQRVLAGPQETRDLYEPLSRDELETL